MNNFLHINLLIFRRDFEQKFIRVLGFEFDQILIEFLLEPQLWMEIGQELIFVPSD
jgi:hypothetical protein